MTQGVVAVEVSETDDPIAYLEAVGATVLASVDVVDAAVDQLTLAAIFDVVQPPCRAAASTTPRAWTTRSCTKSPMGNQSATLRHRHERGDRPTE